MPEYDPNGNLLTRTGGGATWTMKWAGFDKPRWMAKTTGSTTVGSEFHYNAARSRVMQLEFNAMDGTGPTQYNRKRIYALGSTLELNYTTTAPALNPNWDLKIVRIYVPGPDGIIGAREFDVASGATGTEKALVYHYDHLGSITATTLHGTGVIATDGVGKPGKFSEDAWGQRRDPISWNGAPTTTDDGGADSVTPRGFTGHEMLDDLGLVHMNGRIYDPLLGRFLSADVTVQAPGNLQSFNRYSYVMNNPLTLVDPSGYEWEWWKKLKNWVSGGTNNEQQLTNNAPKPKKQDEIEPGVTVLKPFVVTAKRDKPDAALTAGVVATETGRRIGYKIWRKAATETLKRNVTRGGLLIADVVSLPVAIIGGMLIPNNSGDGSGDYISETNPAHLIPEGADPELVSDYYAALNSGNLDLARDILAEIWETRGGRTPEENRKARAVWKNNKEEGRRAWEKRTGQKWPTDANGKLWPAEHTPSLKSGGDPMIVYPRDPGAPDPHNIPGEDGLTDYQRWGALGPPARQAKTGN